MRHIPSGDASELLRLICHGHVANTRPLIDLGVLRPPYQFSLVMGVLGGIRASTRNLVHQVDSLPPDSHRHVIGVGLDQWRLAATVTLGGNVRVGLEDNFYLREGVAAASTGELVEEAVQLCRELGRDVATISQARDSLGLPKEPRTVAA